MEGIEELSKRLETLSEPSLTVGQIADLFRCSRTTAGKIKRAAIREQNGAIRFNTRMVKTDAVFAVQGMDRRREMEDIAESIRKLSEAARP